jgi:hypothetical protein
MASAACGTMTARCRSGHAVRPRTTPSFGSRASARTPNALIRTGLGADAIATALIENLHCLQGKLQRHATRNDWYMARAYSVRDRMQRCCLSFGGVLDGTASWQRPHKSRDLPDQVDEKTVSETIHKVLYPNDEPEAGKQLRLAQQYFFLSCSFQDIIRSERYTPRSIYESDVLLTHDEYIPAGGL